MRSITLVGKDGTELFLGLVPLDFDIDAWTKRFTAAFLLLQIHSVQVRHVAMA